MTVIYEILIVMIVMHCKDMHIMFVRIERVDPMFAMLVLWTIVVSGNVVMNSSNMSVLV